MAILNSGQSLVRPRTEDVNTAVPPFASSFSANEPPPQRPLRRANSQADLRSSQAAVASAGLLDDLQSSRRAGLEQPPRLPPALPVFAPPVGPPPPVRDSALAAAKGWLSSARAASSGGGPAGGLPGDQEAAGGLLPLPSINVRRTFIKCIKIFFQSSLFL